MALIITSDTPEEIWDKFKRLVEDNIIKTWVIDDDEDLTCSNEKWIFKAWFEKKLLHDKGTLAFGIIPSTRFILTNEIYAVYHGRLASTLLAHFDNLIKELKITPIFDTSYDRIYIS